jgi:hypothetical protein
MMKVKKILLFFASPDIHTTDQDQKFGWSSHVSVLMTSTTMMMKVSREKLLVLFFDIEKLFVLMSHIQYPPLIMFPNVNQAISKEIRP